MRFEVENYKNILLFDDLILFSDTFYQSSEDFKYRDKNSKKDELKKISNIKGFEFNSIGNIIILNFEKENRKLIFLSNKRMKDFIIQVKTDQFKLVSKKKIKDNYKSSFFIFIFYFLICLIICGAIFFESGTKGLLKKPIWILFIIAAIFQVKKITNSHEVKYEKINH